MKTFGLIRYSDPVGEGKLHGIIVAENADAAAKQIGSVISGQNIKEKIFFLNEEDWGLLEVPVFTSRPLCLR